jgi:hypothetical protein
MAVHKPIHSIEEKMSVFLEVVEHILGGGNNVNETHSKN